MLSDHNFWDILYIIIVDDRHMEAQSDLSLIWLNTTSSDSNLVSEIAQIQDELRSTIDKNLKLFDDEEQCETFIRSQPLIKNIVLLVDNRTAEWMLTRVPYLCQIICTFVVQTASDDAKPLKENYLTKVGSFSSNF